MTTLRRVLLLAFLAAAGTALVATLHHYTQDRIAYNQEAWRIEQLEQIIDPARYDNDLLLDTLTLHDPELLGAEPVTAYRAYRDGEPTAIILTAVTPRGYNGNITLFIGISIDGDITGVRVIAHQETPGLGDRAEIGKSNWIKQFDGTSLTQPTLPRWGVKKDGGDFDQITGATITARGITEAVQHALIYVEQHQDALWETP